MELCRRKVWATHEESYLSLSYHFPVTQDQFLHWSVLSLVGSAVNTLLRATKCTFFVDAEYTTDQVGLCKLRNTE